MTNQLGWNYRLSELQAAVGIPQIQKLDYLTKIRTELASLLIKELEPLAFLPPIIEQKVRMYSTYLESDLMKMMQDLVEKILSML